MPAASAPPTFIPSSRLARPLRLLVAAMAAAALSGCASLRVDKAAQVASGVASHWLCDDVFVTGREAQAVIDERIKPQPGMGLVSWAMSHRLDTEKREVTTTIAGGFETRARYRDGFGCTSLVAGDPDPAWPSADTDGPAPPPQVPPLAGPAVVIAADARLREVLRNAIDSADKQRHRTKAIVVLRDGRLIAEHYAGGYGVETPVLGFSMTKSVTSALVGILVGGGRLRLDQPAPVPAWQSTNDPRRAITIDQLLRQTSGLDLPQNNSGFDRTSQVMYTVRDKATAFASEPAAAAPGMRWSYTDGHYMLLSRIVRDAVGGNADAVRRFARNELFAPLGMRHVVMDFDATGTPLGSSHLLASARDWARFGQLYLDDGVADGRRLLPEGWVKASATPTLDTGYGAGFWTNRKAGNVPGWGAPWGLSQAPADAFFARGFMGQFIVVVPSRRVVIVRLSVSPVRGDDIEETDRLVGEVLTAL
jgi:CubicO group peptidase (beta-lactamase class C family)